MKASDNEFPKIIIIEGTTPSNPPAGRYKLFIDSADGGLKMVDSEGTVTVVNAPTSGYTEGAKVTNNANQSIPTDQGTLITFNTEIWDTDGIHSTVSNTERLTCQTAGKYIVVASVEFASSNVGSRKIYITKNVNDYQAVTDVPGLTGGVSLVCSAIVDMGVGDYVTLTAVQNSGGDLNIISGANYSPIFSMQRIG